MSETKFTPGPWRLYNKPMQHSQWIESIGTKDRGDIICLAPLAEFIDSLEMWQANAKLIAAAPELLSGCQQALNYLTNNEISAHLQKILKDVIKKATE